MEKILLLISMLYLHIADDYRHQGILTSMKQKSWWEEHAPDDLYRRDYIMALYEHAFSWTVVIHVPAIAYRLYFGNMINLPEFLFLFISMWLVHAMIDDAKCNQHTISLVQDQLAHIVQVWTVWAFYVSI